MLIGVYVGTDLEYRSSQPRRRNKIPQRLSVFSGIDSKNLSVSKGDGASLCQEEKSLACSSNRFAYPPSETKVRSDKYWILDYLLTPVQLHAVTLRNMYSNQFRCHSAGVHKVLRCSLAFGKYHWSLLRVMKRIGRVVVGLMEARKRASRGGICTLYCAPLIRRLFDLLSRVYKNCCGRSSEEEASIFCLLELRPRFSTSCLDLLQSRVSVIPYTNLPI